MTVENYVATPVNDCVTTADINQWLQNLNQIAYCAQISTGGISCRPINGTTANGECLEISNIGLNSNPADVDLLSLEKKTIIGVARVQISDFTTNQGNDPNPIDEANTVSNQGYGDFYGLIKCDGEVVSSTAPFTIRGEGTVVLNGLSCCPKGAKIEVCVVRFSGTGAGSYTVSYCGAMLCIQLPYRNRLTDIGNFCCAPLIPPDCTVGRAGIELLRQNVQALCAYAASGVRTVQCPADVAFTGDGSQLIHTMENDGEYLVVGSVVVCGTVRGIDDAWVYANPKVSCDGQETGCPTIKNIYGYSGNRSACLSFPVYACGRCSAGSEIFAGTDQLTDPCNLSEEDINLLVNSSNFQIESVEQNYTVYTFENSDPVADGAISATPNAFLDKCITKDSVVELVAKSDELATYYTELNAIGSYCEETVATASIPLGDTFQVMVRPPFPLPNPPPNPLPTPWPPEKKTLVTGGVELCFGAGLVGSQPLTITVNLNCGGTVVETFTYTMGVFAGVSIASFCQPLFLNNVVTCPIDQQVDFEVITTGDPAIDVTISTDLLAVCL